MPNYPSLAAEEQQRYVTRVVELANKMPGGAALDPERVAEYLMARSQRTSLAGYTSTENTILKNLVDRGAKLTFKATTKGGLFRRSAPATAVPAAPSSPSRSNAQGISEPASSPKPSGAQPEAGRDETREGEPTPEERADAVVAQRQSNPERPGRKADGASGIVEDKLPAGETVEHTLIVIPPDSEATLGPKHPRRLTEKEWDEQPSASPPDLETDSSPSSGVVSPAPAMSPLGEAAAPKVEDAEPAEPFSNTGLFGQADHTVRPLLGWSGVIREPEEIIDPVDGNGHKRPLEDISDEDLVRILLSRSAQSRAQWREKTERVLRQAERLSDTLLAVEVVERKRTMSVIRT